MKIRKLCVILAAVALGAGGCGSAFRQGTIEGAGPRVTEEGILFSFFSTKATSVSIAGDFNNWSMKADQLQDREGTGMWTILLPLKPGRHEYKFVVDSDKWIRDPGNPETVDDGFGGVNSILVVE
mgnify:CR=1 FL=1